MLGEAIGGMGTLVVRVMGGGGGGGVVVMTNRQKCNQEVSTL
jgi:hypothetical protein